MYFQNLQNQRVFVQQAGTSGSQVVTYAQAVHHHQQLAMSNGGEQNFYNFSSTTARNSQSHSSTSHGHDFPNASFMNCPEYQNISEHSTIQEFPQRDPQNISPFHSSIQGSQNITGFENGHMHTRNVTGYQNYSQAHNFQPVQNFQQALSYHQQAQIQQARNHQIKAQNFPNSEYSNIQEFPSLGDPQNVPVFQNRTEFDKSPLQIINSPGFQNEIQTNSHNYQSQNYEQTQNFQQDQNCINQGGVVSGHEDSKDPSTNHRPPPGFDTPLRPSNNTVSGSNEMSPTSVNEQFKESVRLLAMDVEKSTPEIQSPVDLEFLDPKHMTSPKETKGLDGEYSNGHQLEFHNAPPPQNEEATGIKEVWAHNLREEVRVIRALLRANYTCIAMDTEFPGIVARPIGEFRNLSDYAYQLLKANCDMLRLIQLGISLFDENGNTPEKVTTWQFNFKFSLEEDMYAKDSIDLLANCGLQFKKHESDGIDPMDFSELLITSGLVLNDSVKWISFHGGYDFGYLYRILTGRRLPEEEREFFSYMKLYFPHIYDIKYLMKSCKTLKGGLQEVADELEIERLGYQHQAGSDSLVTGLTFFRMQEMFFEDAVDDSKYNGHLYGLQTNYGMVDNDSTTQPVVEPSSVTAFT